MRAVLRVALGLSFALFSGLVGCGTSLGHGSASADAAGYLRASQEVPVVTDDSARGFVTFKANSADNPTSAVVTIETVGLTSATSIDVCDGKPGTTGPVLFSLWTPAKGTFASTMTLTADASNFTAQPGVAVVKTAILNLSVGTAYINISTAAHPTGQIRSYPGQVGLIGTLSGANMVPPSGDTATTTGRVKMDALQDKFDVIVGGNLYDGSKVTSVEIHVGAAGTTGPAIFTLPASAGKVDSGYWTASDVDNSKLTIQVGAGVDQFEDAVNALITGQCYLVVKTAAHPDGALRCTLTAE